MSGEALCVAAMKYTDCCSITVVNGRTIDANTNTDVDAIGAAKRARQYCASASGRECCNHHYRKLQCNNNDCNVNRSANHNTERSTKRSVKRSTASVDQQSLFLAQYIECSQRPKSSFCRHHYHRDCHPNWRIVCAKWHSNGRHSGHASGCACAASAT